MSKYQRPRPRIAALAIAGLLMVNSISPPSGSIEVPKIHAEAFTTNTKTTVVTTMATSTDKKLSSTVTTTATSTDKKVSGTVTTLPTGTYTQEAYLAPDSGWFSIVGTWEDVYYISQYNGFSSPEDTVLPGWYEVPAGIVVNEGVAIRFIETTTTTTTTTTTAPETTFIETTTTEPQTAVTATTTTIATAPPQIVQISNIPALQSAGFAFGTSEEMIIGHNLQSVKPVNCIGKVSEIAYWLQTLEANDADIKSAVEITASDVVISDGLIIYAGDIFRREELGYMAISPSSNTSYNAIKRDMMDTFGIDLVAWREEKFGRIRNNGSYGNSTPELMYAEAQYVLNYINSGSKYAEYLKYWLELSGEYYQSGYSSNQLDESNFAYIGFKIGCYEETRSEMLFLQDNAGNWYIGVILTTANADSAMEYIGNSIDNYFNSSLAI